MPPAAPAFLRVHFCGRTSLSPVKFQAHLRLTLELCKFAACEMNLTVKANLSGYFNQVFVTKRVVARTEPG